MTETQKHKWIMAEVTQASYESAQKLFDAALGDMASYAEYGRPSYREGAIRHIGQGLEAAFAAGRASVIAELENPTEAMIDAAREVSATHGQHGHLRSEPISATLVAATFTAMIGAYKEAGK